MLPVKHIKSSKLESVMPAKRYPVILEQEQRASLRSPAAKNPPEPSRVPVFAES